MISSFIKNERGIAMTEGVITIPFFIIVWMALIYLHHVYTARLEAQVEAHHVALKGAMKGKCSGKKGVSSSESTSRMREDVNQKTDSSTDDGKNVNIVNQAEKTSGSEKNGSKSGGNSLFDWSPYLIEWEVAAQNIPETFGGPTVVTSGEAKIMCNMVPRESLADAFFNLVKSWFN
jgi:hypothetical protein